MTILHTMEPAINKSNAIENPIASGWMSGSFSSGFDQNTNLSNNKRSASKHPNVGQERTHTHLSQAMETKQPNVVRNILRRTSDVAKNALVTGNYTARVNPFNKDGHGSEDEDDSLSRSNASEFTSTTSESGDVSLAELGLTEDYFAHPEALFGMSSVEELEAAIDNCKKMILELAENSERRKKYVKKLVELRMKYQELKEGPEEIEPKVKQVLGHKLRKRNSSSMKYYCDCCNNLIWGMLQVWYRCRECGFSCHSKCVNSIRRECVAVGIKNITYSLSISPEIGLSAQQFHCAECKNFICIGGAGKEEARICDYTGQYFCPNCHWNDTLVLPARVMHNWDFTLQKVSRRSYQLLQRMSRRPLLNVQEINPMLFNYVEELADIRKLREDILLMKAYFTTCTKALEMKLLLKLEHQQHFVDNSNMYSMADLVKAQDGSLTEHITDIHASFAKHIKLDCMYCQAKGFICEICNSGEPLFPFDFGVATCGKCRAVFHRDCFTCIDTLCPRCERLQKKRMQKTAPDTPSEESEPETNYLHNETTETEIYPSNERNPESIFGHSAAKKELVPEKPFSAVARPNVADSTALLNGRIEDHQTKPIGMNSHAAFERKKHELNSLHMLLTDSSYKDYALLGFAGAGKGRKSSQPFNTHASALTTNNSPRIYGRVNNFVGSSYESTPPESYASYGSGQKVASISEAFTDSYESTSSERRESDKGGKKTADNIAAKPARTGKQGGSERRGVGSRRNSKEQLSKSMKSRKRVSPKEARKSSLANFIEDSGMSADIRLRTNSGSESVKRDERASSRKNGSKRNETLSPRSSRETGLPTNEADPYDNRFNPFANTDETSNNSDSGYGANPFLNQDNAGSPFVPSDKGRTVQSSNGNPFESDDHYDEEKNPFL